jgi:hypothetical protein
MGAGNSKRKNEPTYREWQHFVFYDIQGVTPTAVRVLISPFKHDISVKSFDNYSANGKSNDQHEL